MAWLLRLTAWLVSGILLLFTLRRWLFGLAALLPDPPSPADPPLPSVLLLVPIHNEAAVLPALLQALAWLEYPSAKLTVVLIDDGSTDGSPALIRAWTATRERWHACLLTENVGKAEALNTALRRFTHSDIIAIYDADERPMADALHRLVASFVEADVGGVSGRRASDNSLASPAAAYTTFENIVHQRVTMRAKDRLDLAPALLGANCAYRRTALAAVGYFRAGALLEDSDLTLKLARAGWRVRFEPRAVSYHAVPESIPGYWRQHTRWARGFNEVAKEQAPALLSDARLPLPLRLELLIFSLGYLDRPALLLGLLLLPFVKPRRGLVMTLCASLLTPVFQIIIALYVGREPLALWQRLIWLPLFFTLDVAMAITGLWRTLRQTPQIWEERRLRQ